MYNMTTNNKGVSFCFTDFKQCNLDAGYGYVYEKYKDIIRGIAWGLETCPTTGKMHNQGYIQLFKQARFSSIQKMINSKCHFEIMCGSVNESEKYCSKEGDLKKCGNFVSKGYRSDLHNIKDDLKNGASMYEIMNNYTGDFVRYHSGIEKMKTLIEEESAPEWRDIETTVLVGDAGSGKTSFVYKKHGHKNIFKIDSCGDTDKFLFDGYKGQKVLLIDDFNGWIKYTAMLNILDGYPLPLNIKGGRTTARWDTVYITSNVTPKYWYKKIFDNFRRRLDKCLLVTKGNTERLSHSECWDESDDDTSVENDPTCESIGKFVDLSSGYC